MRKIIAVVMSVFVLAMVSAPDAVARSRSTGKHSKTHSRKTRTKKDEDPTTYIVKTSETMAIGEFEYGGVRYTMQSNGKITRSGGENAGKFLYEDGGYWVYINLGGNISGQVKLEIIDDEVFAANSPEDAEPVARVEWFDLKKNQYVK